MSGGVDSSVSAYLLLEQGFEVIGLTFINYEKQNPGDYQFVEDAKFVAERLKIKHFVLDIREEFKKKIIEPFVREYLSGKTPNPCVICNRIIKWRTFIEFADEINADYVATGHYAVLKAENGRYFISKGADDWKDQSYFLWNLPQEYLQRSIFPLGDKTKDQIKELAKNIGLETVAEKKESYDVCFVRTGDYRTFLNDYIEKHQIETKQGFFTDEEGNILGKHTGLHNYTVGQRKGLGIALGKPVYVKKIDAQTGNIVIAEKQGLAKKSVKVKDFNLQKYSQLPENKHFHTKIRYKDKGAFAYAKISGNEMILEFEKEIYGVAPGQSAVLYEDSDVVAGGIIVG